MGVMPILGNPLDDLPHLKPFAKKDKIVPVRNPMSEDFTHLRPSLLPSLITAASHNYRQQQESIMLFELDKIFFYNNKKRPDEKYSLAIVLCGQKNTKAWYNTKPEFFDIFHAKGLFEQICDFLKTEYEMKYENIDIFKEGESITAFYNEKEFARIGRIKKSIAKTPVFSIEINIEDLIDKALEASVISGWSNYPSTERDVALILDKNIPAGKILGFIEKFDSDILVDSQIFDLYAKKPIPKGKKSLGISMLYQSSERTLTDEEVDKVQDRLVEKLVEKFEAEIRVK
jgi:phenylalanyl-tRNA synthetase beta chain